MADAGCLDGVDDFIDKALHYINFHSKIKQEQRECLKSLFAKKDVLAVLPTGFGKSLIYQLAPFVMSLGRGIDVDNTPFFCMVITPLNSIMVDQCSALAKYRIKACALEYSGTKAQSFLVQQPTEEDFGSGDDHDDDGGLEDSEESTTGCVVSSVPLSDVKAGKYQVVYTHPEAVISTHGGREMTRSDAFKKNLICIAIDEAHMILEWGSDFRKDFGRIGDELLSRFPDVPVLVLTATASPTAQQGLIKQLKLRDPVKIIRNPDRVNIHYSKIKRPPSLQTEDHLEEILSPMVQDLLRDKVKYPLTVIYTDTKVISFAYVYFEKNMGSNQYIGEAKPENRLFAQYHQVYPEDMKRFIVQEMCKEQSNIRVVFATVALGMGLDAPHIRKIIHYKPPTSLEKYFQETGRAGRDGEPSHAVLYYNNTDIRANRPGIEKDIIQYCRNDSMCYRDMMLEHFGHKSSPDRDENNCCDYCDKLQLPGDDTHLQ